MTETTTGEITFSHLGNNPATGEKYGLVTIKVSDNEIIDFKIDASTKYDELKIGALVAVTYKENQEADHLIATKVLNVNNQ
ncbi:MAG: hypothetical protein RTV31_03820 [Candidatus Thorarchaeota archaeon]